MMLSRRELIALLGGAAALLGCGSAGADAATPPVTPPPPPRGSARLAARPVASPSGITAGTWPITSSAARDGSLLVPSSYSARDPMPLVVAFHGAGGSPGESINLLGALAESRGFLLLAIGSRGATWDGVLGTFGRDVAFIDAALKWAFGRCAVDPAKVIVEGFSDGASYALAMALANGDLFTRAIAFSPGFIPESESVATGKPSFFFSHGRQDPILNIDLASRQLAPRLSDRGYEVFYTEFDGGHTVPAPVSVAAVDWMLRPA